MFAEGEVLVAPMDGPLVTQVLADRINADETVAAEVDGRITTVD